MLSCSRKSAYTCSNNRDLFMRIQGFDRIGFFTLSNYRLLPDAFSRLIGMAAPDRSGLRQLLQRSSFRNHISALRALLITFRGSGRSTALAVHSYKNFHHFSALRTLHFHKARGRFSFCTTLKYTHCFLLSGTEHAAPQIHKNRFCAPEPHGPCFECPAYPETISVYHDILTKGRKYRLFF